MQQVKCETAEVLESGGGCEGPTNLPCCPERSGDRAVGKTSDSFAWLKPTKGVMETESEFLDRERVGVHRVGLDRGPPPLFCIM